MPIPDHSAWAPVDIPGRAPDQPIREVAAADLEKLAAAELRRREDRLRAREERERKRTFNQLVATLTRAQLIVNRDRLASPPRVAAELPIAADRLGGLMEQAELTHRSTIGLAERYDLTPQRLTDAILALQHATTDLSAAASGVQNAATVMEVSGSGTLASGTRSSSKDRTATGIWELDGHFGG